MKFNRIVKSIILEQGRYEILRKTYTEPKKKGNKVKPARMSKEELDKIVLADPTTASDGDKIKKAGKYTQWLLKQFNGLNRAAEQEAEYGTPAYKSQLTRMKELFFEDLYKTTEDLQKFDRFKNKLDQEDRDINNLSIEKLNDLMLPYSLEKTKATKDEKKEASKTYEHPGGDIIFRGANWTVVKISDQGQLGKDAACFYGGNDKKPSKGESGWCTSSPGLNYFNTYIKQGPLYVIIPNTPQEFLPGGPKVGEISGLPAKRYQFHFPSNQFMDANDRQIDLIQFLNNNDELKEVFKPEFMKGLSSSDGTQVSVEYPRDSASKFITLYGFEEFFEELPSNLGRLDFIKSSNRGGEGEITVAVPPSVGRFKDMYALHLSGIVEEIPKEVSDLENLIFLSLPDNPKLKTLPKEIAKKNGNNYAMDMLQVINLNNVSPNFKMPEEIQKMIDEKGIQVFK